jgi:DNA-directed RNA polymerase I subunit RPA43
VKKIIAMDEDIAQCSNSAAFAISVATVRVRMIVVVILWLTKVGDFHPVLNRASIQCCQIRAQTSKKHCIQRYGWAFLSRTHCLNCWPSQATAVSRIDNLEFLADVIPKTTTYKQFKEKKARDEAEAAAAAHPGQTTLQNGVNGQMGVHSGEHSVERVMTDGTITAANSNSRPTTIVNGSPIADRTLSSAPHAHPGAEDVEMQG